MKEEQLTALGISKELVTKVLDIYKEDTKDMIPRFRYDEVKEKYDGVSSQLKEANNKIGQLSKFEGTNTELQEKINKIQEELSTKEKEYTQKVGELSKKNLVKVSLLSEEKRPYDADIALGLIQLDKIILDTNSEKIIGGYKEQVEELQKNKPFLFSAGQGEPRPHGNEPQDGDGNKPSGDDKFVSFGKSLAAAQLKSMGISPKK